MRFCHSDHLDIIAILWFLTISQKLSWQTWPINKNDVRLRKEDLRHQMVSLLLKVLKLNRMVNSAIINLIAPEITVF